MPIRTCSITLIALSSLFTALPTVANVQSTPLRVYATSPFQANSLATQLRSGFAAQSVEVFAIGTISSTWAHSDNFELDYYQNQAFTGVQWRVNDRLSAEVGYQYSWAGNNHLDSLTISFHDLFNIGQNGRDEAGKHQFNIESDQYGFHISDFEDETMVNAFHGYLQYQLFDTGYQALSLGGSLYYNKVNDGPFKESSFEQGAQINYSVISGPNAIFSTFGVNHRNESDLLNTPLPIKKWSAAWALGYGRRFGNHEALLQYHGFQGTLDDDSDFADASHEVVLGYRYYHRQLLLELSMTENIVNMDNSTDIGFSAGIRYLL